MQQPNRTAAILLSILKRFNLLGGNGQRRIARFRVPDSAIFFPAIYAFPEDARSRAFVFRSIAKMSDLVPKYGVIPVQMSEAEG